MVLDIGLPTMSIWDAMLAAWLSMRSSRTWLTSGQASVHDKLLEEVQNQLVELKGMAERNKSSESGEVILEERVQQHAEEEIAGERICEQISRHFRPNTFRHKSPKS